MSDRQEQTSLPITVIVCRRGRKRKAAACDEPRCDRGHEYLCDFELRGKKAGRTCDKKLCPSHATVAGPGKHYCPAHAVLARKEGVL